MDNMPNIILFQPKREQSARQNLNDFVSFCRNTLSLYSNDSDWNWSNPVWAGVGGFVRFGVKATAKNMGRLTADQCLDSDFSDFAKAYIRYKQSTDAAQAIALWFIPIKAIEQALIEVKKSGDVTLVDSLVMDQAAVVLQQQTDNKTSLYDGGRRLEVIADFLVQKGLVRNGYKWKSPFCSVKRQSSRLDKASKDAKASKMPGEDVLIALAELFALDLQNPRDRFTTSACALLMCAPSRGSELFSLSVHCIHREKTQDGKEQIGIKWHAKKGGGHDIKYVPSAMQDVAVKSVERLQALSSEGRKLALWLEQNNGSFYRTGRLLGKSANEALSNDDVLHAFGISRDSSIAWLSIAEIVRKYVRDDRALYEKVKNTKRLTLSDLDELSRRRLPKDFPFVDKSIGLKYSESLFCMRKNETDHVAARYYELWMPNISILLNDLGKSDVRRENIFKRHGYDGMSMTTHQFRHYLNTLAHRGSVGELDIAKWSGRANLTQNTAYNHMQDHEYVAKVMSSGSISIISEPLRKITIKDPYLPVTLADLNEATKENDRVAHVTEYGFCVHDFAQSPCNKCNDCLNCSEQVCVKGDDEKLQRLIAQRESLNDQLEKAKLAVDDGIYGADRWHGHNQRTINRLSHLISIMESETVSDGAVIRLNNDLEDYPLKRTLRAKMEMPNPDLPNGVSLDSIISLLGK